MKSLFLILVISICNTAQGQSIFEWYKVIHVDKIEMPGNKILFTQNCMPEEDSLIVNGSIRFKNATNEQYGDFVYVRNVKDTIYTDLEVWFKGGNRVKSLRKFLLDLDSNIVLKEEELERPISKLYQFKNNGVNYYAFVTTEPKKYTKIIITNNF